MTKTEELLASLSEDERAELLAALTKPPPPPPSPPPVQVPALTCPHCGNVPFRGAGSGYLNGVRHIDFLAEYRGIWQDDDGSFQREEPEKTEVLDTAPELECERCRETFAYPAGVTVGWA